MLQLKHYRVLQSHPLSSSLIRGLSSYLLVDLSGSRHLCVGCPCPGAGSPAGSAAACARSASDLLVEGTAPPGIGLCAGKR